MVTETNTIFKILSQTYAQLVFEISLREDHRRRSTKN